MIEKGSKLKAKCPHCDTGCEKCSEGYTEVTFGTEDSVLYSLIFGLNLLFFKNFN